MTTQISDMQSQLHKIQQNTACIFNDDYWAKLHVTCVKIGVDVELLSRRRTLIQSLRYECMEDRHETIKNAHKKTFDWMFTSFDEPMQEGISQPANGFAQWLKTGSDIYWVTGKPGMTRTDAAALLC